MTAAEVERILWLDDQMDQIPWVGQVRETFEADGVELVTAVDLEAFEAELGMSSFVAVIVDYLLKEGTGVDIVRSIAPNLDSPVLFLTQHHDASAEAQHAVDPILVPRTIGKPAPGAGITAIAEWLQLILLPAVDNGSSIFKRLASLESNANDFSLGRRLMGRSAAEVASLPLDDQLDVREEAVKALEHWLAPRFNDDGVDWLVVIGEQLEVVQWGGYGDSLPGVEELLKYQKSYDRVPLVVFRPLDIGIIPNAGMSGYWSDCGEKKLAAGLLDHFPEVHLEFRGASAAFHFDTGSEASFLSSENWVKPGHIPAPSSPLEWFTRPVRVGLGDPEPITFFHFRDAGALTPSRRGNVRVEFVALVVRKWRTSKLSLVCRGGRCAGSTPVDSGPTRFHCGSREGLVGRNFLLSNRLNMVLDGQNHRTYVISEDDLVQLGEDEAKGGVFSRWRWGAKG